MGATAAPPARRYSAGFTTLEDETTIESLPLEGELPAWLGGSLLRTGPARFEVGEQKMRHWFDGLAMLHRFTIGGGRVEYGNRWLHGRAEQAAQQKGEIAYSEFATDPCRSLFKRVQTLFSPGAALSDNCNVNVTKLGERYIAMTETPIPVQFDARTLETAQAQPYEVPGVLTTAHPHLDRASGGMLNYAVKLGPKSEYRFFHLAPDGHKPRVIGSREVKEPAYMHSFGLTGRWLVLVEFPFVVNPLALALSGRPYIENYRWKPERGTRVTLIDRASGERVEGFQTDPFFCFHHVNAYEEGDEVVVDMCTYPDASIVEDLYLERLRAGKPVQGATLTRLRLDPRSRTVARETLSEQNVELPRINYGRCNERPYRHLWGNATGAEGWLEEIVHIDLADGSAKRWHEPDCYPGEPVFVARPEAEAEEDGVLLSVVLDGRSERSFLLVLDAATLEELARAQVPHHIPFSFHGQFMRA